MVKLEDVNTVAAAIDAYLRKPEPWLRELILLAAFGADPTSTNR